MSPDFKREVAVSVHYPQLSTTLLLFFSFFFQMRCCPGLTQWGNPYAPFNTYLV